MFNMFILATTFRTLVAYMFCTMAEIVLARRDGKPARTQWRNTVIACLAFAFAL